jgi:hypothetical protein
MSVVESMLGMQFLTGLLQGDSTLAGLAPGGVWRGDADPATATPAVIVVHQASKDSLTVTGVRPLVTAIYQVKVTGPANNTAGIVTAANQVDALLGGNSGLRNQSTPGGWIGSCYRDGEIIQDLLVTGEKWFVAGGMYSLQISQTS